MADRFIKLLDSDDTDKLQRDFPNAYLLFTWIARKVRWKVEEDGLEIGQCEIKDFRETGIKTYDMYRSAKKVLQNKGYIKIDETRVNIPATSQQRPSNVPTEIPTKKPTNHTIVSISNSDICDVNINLKTNRNPNRNPSNVPATSQQRPNRIREPIYDKECKEGKEGKEISSCPDSPDLQSSSALRASDAKKVSFLNPDEKSTHVLLQQEDKSDNIYHVTDSKIVENPTQPTKIYQDTKLFSSDVHRVKEFLFSQVSKNFPKQKVKHDDWLKSVDLMLRIDERNPEECLKLIEWACNEDFWKGNIRSPDKFREKFDELKIKFESGILKRWSSINIQNFFAWKKDAPVGLKHMVFQEDRVINTQNQKDLIFKMHPDAFESNFVAISGAKYAT